MITCIREIRRAKGLTLLDVAERCAPPTTAQTIGRLEMGTRTVSVGWLNRIADALGVAAADLVRLPTRADLPIVADLGLEGARALSHPVQLPLPEALPGMVAVRVVGGVGDYRAGDIIWCERLDPARFGEAMNRDIVAPRPAGRFGFGRLIQREAGKLLLLPPTPGAKSVVVADPAWIGVARKLVRDLR
ncbi:helix-turn-helix transcriptional regulator [Sphingomonas sp. BIUV-7]|uniref:Helix-turn-helix transcriptional regulator n=1 Tax=Sphingomonas natans TaxID=3063330 RepID=A0ABT8Y5B5_9SPHN|nr:helix-turn-helix transcriptional regulator [Sphingomonas sp. BIUV-7]MDO6413510.1 helix-turn-helix transcriptional regulator [Sphingomonas sp. BIUV-7]